MPHVFVLQHFFMINVFLFPGMLHVLWLCISSSRFFDAIYTVTLLILCTVWLLLQGLAQIVLAVHQIALVLGIIYHLSLILYHLCLLGLSLGLLLAIQRIKVRLSLPQRLLLATLPHRDTTTTR